MPRARRVSRPDLLSRADSHYEWVLSGSGRLQARNMQVAYGRRGRRVHDSPLNTAVQLSRAVNVEAAKTLPIAAGT